jgi:serine/threonine protein kinase
VLLLYHAHTEPRRAQIEREIQTLRSLHHPKIPSYLDDFKTESASYCIVQEFIDAQTLAKNNNFTPEEIKSIAIQLLEILVYLQSLLPPIIHRDIKPENIGSSGFCVETRSILIVSSTK